MITVFLDDLRFHALRGMFDEEHQTGTELSVTLELKYQEDGQIDQLSQTINYSDVFQVVKSIINNPGRLLETLAMDIAEQLKSQFPQILEINISISKLQAPILNFQGRAGVRFQKKFEL